MCMVDDITSYCTAHFHYNEPNTCRNFTNTGADEIMLLLSKDLPERKITHFKINFKAALIDICI